MDCLGRAGCRPWTGGRSGGASAGVSEAEPVRNRSVSVHGRRQAGGLRFGPIILRLYSGPGFGARDKQADAALFSIFSSHMFSISFFPEVSVRKLGRFCSGMHGLRLPDRGRIGRLHCRDTLSGGGLKRIVHALFRSAAILDICDRICMYPTAFCRHEIRVSVHFPVSCFRFHPVGRILPVLRPKISAIPSAI